MPASILSSVTGAEAATSVLGTEDCLNLAVFTPDLKPRKLLPVLAKTLCRYLTAQKIVLFQVLVFIHGGAFIIGSYTAYGPHYLLVTDERVSNSDLSIGRPTISMNLLISNESSLSHLPSSWITMLSLSTSITASPVWASFVLTARSLTQMSGSSIRFDRIVINKN